MYLFIFEGEPRKIHEHLMIGHFLQYIQIFLVKSEKMFDHQFFMNLSMLALKNYKMNNLQTKSVGSRLWRLCIRMIWLGCLLNMHTLLEISFYTKSKFFFGWNLVDFELKFWLKINFKKVIHFHEKKYYFCLKRYLQRSTNVLKTYQLHGLHPRTSEMGSHTFRL